MMKKYYVAWAFLLMSGIAVGQITSDPLANPPQESASTYQEVRSTDEIRKTLYASCNENPKCAATLREMEADPDYVNRAIRNNPYYLLADIKAAAAQERQQASPEPRK
jgi:hypothetical protein